MDSYQTEQIAEFVKRTENGNRNTAQGYLELNGWCLSEAVRDYSADMRGQD
jgi:hypothetical protein